MSHDFTPIQPRQLVSLLSEQEQAAAINIHYQFQHWFMIAEASYDAGHTAAGRSSTRMQDARLEDLDRLLMSRFMAEGPEIEAITYRAVHAERARS